MGKQEVEKSIVPAEAAMPDLKVAAGVAAADINIGAGQDSAYGNGPLLAIVPPEFLKRVEDFNPELLKDLDRPALLALSKHVWPVSELQRLRDDPEFRASVVLNQITPRARLASQLGMNHAVLYAVHPREIDTGDDGPRIEGIVQPELLTGAAKLVWNHVQKCSVGYPESRQPTLDYWQSGINNDAGHNIVIHFDTSTKVETVSPEQLGQAAIKQLPVRAVLECLAGRYFASALSFYDGDENFIEKDPSKYPEGSARYSPGNVEPYMLKGSAKEVWDYCIQKDVAPTLEYWETTDQDGNAISGFEIVIHWYQHKNDDGTFRDGDEETEALKNSDPRYKGQD